MANLDSITIRGFKSIKSLENFKLNKLNILVGANGAGKSNFIELFRIISAMMQPGGLREYVAGSADSFFYGGPKRTPRIEVRLKFGLNGYDFDLTPTNDGFLMIEDEQRHYLPRGDYATRHFLSGTFDAELPKDLHSEATKYTYDAITSWQIYHFHDTGKLAGMRRYCDMGHNAKLAFDARNIAAFLFRLKKEHEKVYQHIVDVIKLVVPFFEDFVLVPNEEENIRLSWKQTGMEDFPMRPIQLSDGAIRFICLATALLQPTPPSTMILDEPELGLHPEAIHVLAELIQLASRQTQVIVATQSPLLLDDFGINDIIVVRRSNGATVFDRLKEDDFKAWRDEYSVGELWTHDIIHGGTSIE